MTGEAVAPRRSGRPPLTDRATLLAAARSIGFAGLTVGAVTTAVGVKYSTFYRHFPSLDTLVTELADQVCAELDLPAPGGRWQDTVAGTCRAVGEMLDRHPGMAAAVVALPQVPVQVLALYRRLTDVLLEAGFDGEQAALGAVCALETVTVTELTTPGEGRTLPGRQRQLEALDPPLDPRVRAATAGLDATPAGAWTGRKIALLIRGLEVDLQASSGSGS